jgi:hypothetical protein
MKKWGILVCFGVLLIGVFIFTNVDALTTLSKYSTWSEGDSACIYDAGGNGVLSGREIVAENPSGSDDCNMFDYIVLGEGVPSLTKDAVYNSGDSGCVYNCPIDYALSSVFSEVPSTVDCNSYKCLFIGTGGEVYTSPLWVSGVSPPVSGAPWWSTDDSGCVYKCPAGYALQYFVAENPSGIGDCNSFTCQKVTLCGESQKIMKLFQPSNSHGEISPLSVGFGGMYGTSESNVCLYANPATSSCSCPSGYISYNIHGTPSTDNNVYFCYIPSETLGVLKFGGGYGYGLNYTFVEGSTENGGCGIYNGVANYVNSLTGFMSCPSGYTATQITGMGGLDDPSYFCWKANLDNVSEYDFGGMMGGTHLGGTQASIKNPITDSYWNCPWNPNGATTLLTLGCNRDYPIAYCVKPSYPQSICYSDIFGSEYSGANPHTCTGSNKVVGLSDITNSHSEVPSLDSYNTDVCYGDLTCTVRDNSCQGNEKNVVNLYQNSNSHLTDPNYIPAGVVGHWKLDNSLGYVADSSGNGNDGIPISETIDDMANVDDWSWFANMWSSGTKSTDGKVLDMSATIDEVGNEYMVLQKSMPLFKPEGDKRYIAIRYKMDQEGVDHFWFNLWPTTTTFCYDNISWQPRHMLTKSTEWRTELIDVQSLVSSQCVGGYTGQYVDFVKLLINDIDVASSISTTGHLYVDYIAFADSDYVNGKINGAIKLDGGDDYVSVSTSPSLEITQDITVEMWVNPSSTQADYSSLLDKHDCNPVGSWSVQQNADQTNKYYFGVSIGGVGYCNQSNLYSTTLMPNQWQHFVVERKGDKVYHYLNGVQTVSCNAALGNLDPSSSPLKIGYSCLDRYFNGMMDEVAIYNRALTQQEIQDRYNIGAYEKKICCYGTVAMPQANWTNLNGEFISSTNMSDTVRLILTNTGLAANTSVTFEIYEKDGITSDDSITSISGIVDASGAAMGSWRILKSGLNATSDYNDFYFTVNGYESGYLSVSEEAQDDPMRIIIISPKCGSDYNKSEVIEIQINATDADDVITGSVTIEPNVFNFTNGLFIQSYSLNEAGNLQFVIFGTNTRGYTQRTISSVMVVDITRDGSYIAACIDRPADFSDIGSGEVKFEAFKSRGIKYYVSNLSKNNVSKSELNFYWAFSDKSINPITDGTNPRSYDFFKTFVEAGHNWATLEVEMKS